MANVLILRSVNTPDKDIKTGYAEVELQNGYGVALGEVSADRATRNAYKLAAPEASSEFVGLVYNADVASLRDDEGNIYKGIVHDPRKIAFPKGTVVNVWMPAINAEIAMTDVKGTADGAKYVVYNAGSMEPRYATEIGSALKAFKITGHKFVSIGAERVPTVEMICVQ